MQKMMPMTDRDDFIDQYVETALWSSTDEEGEPLDRDYSVDDFDDVSLTDMEQDAGDFYDANEHMLFDDGNDARHGGHMFWLTRNGHGAGFWDGDYDQHGDELSDNSKAYGEVYLYVGDDGKVYV